MKHLDATFVRQQFPAFSEESLKGTVFMENAGGSYMCRQVMDRLNTFYHQCKVQPYYPNPVSMKAGDMMDEAYGALAKWMNVNADDVYFGPSTSQNTYVLSKAVLGWLQPGDEVIVTNQDHEANSGAWRRLESQGMVVKQWSIDPETGSLDVADLERLITPKTKLLTFPHCSNILGEINPVAAFCKVAKDHGVRTVVDGVSFAGHGLPDVPALGADIYLFSLYKVYGPHQGVMVIAPDMVPNLRNQGHYFHEEVRVKRLMPSGPDHAQIASIKGVSDYFDALLTHHEYDGPNSDQEKAKAVRTLLKEGERPALSALLDYIAGKDGLRLVGPAELAHRNPTVSVVPAGKTPWELAERLGEKGILCGAGHFYSVRLIKALGIDPDLGVLRFSLVHYTSGKDVQRLATELDKLL
ncbi:MAG: aminotransferase class V-fold PLP-dependent enzyme [Desulfovibrio sp.]|uniref:aminotransferase class V-fold PLP-dependent enzyme n=1 Tax=Desulfovibrio sp. 7SRBS1 TaxID=3378064 RepID=UPI003B3D28B7